MTLSIAVATTTGVAAAERRPDPEGTTPCRT